MPWCLWPGRVPAARSWGAPVRGSSACVLAAEYISRVGLDTPPSFDQCQPGLYYQQGDIITPSWILRDSPARIKERKLMSLYDPHI